ncbi:MAG: acyl-CoA thioesterase [Candidatus Sedimenticola sp. 1PA]
MPIADAPSLRVYAMPADTNPRGDVFGGWLMSQMDLAGGTFARYIALNRVVTVKAETTFLKAVEVGDDISIYCRVARIGNTSITVEMECWAKRLRSEYIIKVNEGIYTFVAISDKGTPQPIPKSHQASEQ